MTDALKNYFSWDFKLKKNQFVKVGLWHDQLGDRLQKMSLVNTELACQFCTFINERGTKICVACGRSLGLPSVNLTPTGIQCPTCTYENPYGSSNCAMCGNVVVGQELLDVTMDTEAMCQICCCNMQDEFKMPGCTHIFCISCAKMHFTIKIKECGINNFRCPIDVCVCFDELHNKSEFFKNLKFALHGVLDDETRKIFDDKVGILDIMNKPGFLRCPLCNHGYINESKTKMAHCPSCLKSFCNRCGKKWVSAHAKTNCEPNESGLDENGSTDDLQIHTNATCPQCKYKYYLERGGCMHITCSQCSHEYCEFCFKKITGKGKSCQFPKCTKAQSLHGHHPRNCMYYVQEMEHKKLEKLLKSFGVRPKLIQSKQVTSCNVKVNVSIGGSWVDAQCKKPSTASFNNMCLNHYKWHLGELMKKHKIDPVDAMNNLECICELKRNNVAVPPNKPNYNQPIEDQDTPALRALVRAHIPYSEI